MCPIYKNLKMNCTEFKIWLDRAKLPEIRKPEKKIEDHLKTCNTCINEYTTTLKIFSVIDIQKNQSLDSRQTEKILENLMNQKQILRPYFKFSKVATIAIIVAGLITGAIAGNLLTNLKTENNENAWSNEFSMLSDNSEYESYLFE